jgi:hypothetical protein
MSTPNPTRAYGRLRNSYLKAVLKRHAFKSVHEDYPEESGGKDSGITERTKSQPRSGDIPLAQDVSPG